MPTGTVKWFNETKGYGFIEPDQGGKDVFVHISAVERSGMQGLREGMKVSYEVEADRKSGKEFGDEFEGGLSCVHAHLRPLQRAAYRSNPKSSPIHSDVSPKAAHERGELANRRGSPLGPMQDPELARGRPITLILYARFWKAEMPAVATGMGAKRKQVTAFARNSTVACAPPLSCGTFRAASAIPPR